MSWGRGAFAARGRRRFAFAAAALVVAPVALARQTKDAAAPTLKAGMPAPALAIEKWVKGSPVASFEQGKVYVVEFWATWCGPCIATMPHLSALQHDYKDSVTFIGTNIWERKYDEGTLATIEKFVATQGERMAYTVAYDGPAKAMDASYMKAAGRNGIPSAFIVDKNGVVAWIGHPGGMDYALSEVVAGTWDVAAGPEREKKVMGELKSISMKLKTDAAGAQADFAKFESQYPAVAKHQDDLKLGLLKAGGQWDKAYAIIAVKVDDAIARKDANSLNAFAWDIVDPEAEIAQRDLELALRAALKADEFTEHKNPPIIDTVARCYAWKGDLGKALELQTKAVALAEADTKMDPAMKEGIKKALEEYKAKNAQ